MKQKLRGCRPSKDVIQDYSNISAQLGDTIFQIHRSHQKKQELLKRQEELAKEVDAAHAQEKELADKAKANPDSVTNFKVGQEFEANSIADVMAGNIREVKPEVVNG